MSLGKPGLQSAAPMSKVSAHKQSEETAVSSLSPFLVKSLCLSYPGMIRGVRKNRSSLEVMEVFVRLKR